MIKDYYRLTKPGIIYGNALNATAGFFLASQTTIDFGLLPAMLTGLSAIIASACVFNNYIDRNLDKQMARTKNRALAANKIPYTSALAFSGVLLAVGIILLATFTNILTLLVATFGFSVYVFIYSNAKPKTAWATIIGSFAGATPPVIGYCAVTGHLDSAAWVLFLILIFWQMPHFYSIAIYRSNDYKAAGVPVLPLIKGLKATKVQITLWVAAFTVAALALSPLGYTGHIYAVVMALTGLLWLRLAINGLKAADSKLWARQMFKFSLRVTLITSLMLAVGGRLP